MRLKKQYGLNILFIILILPSYLNGKDFILHQEDLLASNFNTFIYSKNKNDYWIASCEEGWTHFYYGHRETFRFRDAKSGLKGNYVQSHLFEDDLGNLYTTSDNYLNIFKNKSHSFTSIKIKYQNHGLKEDYKIVQIIPESNLLLISADHMLFYYDYKIGVITEIITKSTKSNRFLYLNNQLILGIPWIESTGFDKYYKNKDKWCYLHFKDSINIQRKNLPNHFNKSLIQLGNNVIMPTDYGLAIYDIYDSDVKIFPSPNNTNIADVVNINGEIIVFCGNRVYSFNILKHTFGESELSLYLTRTLKKKAIDNVYFDIKNNLLYVCYKRIGVQILNLDIFRYCNPIEIYSGNDIKKTLLWFNEILIISNKKILLSTIIGNVVLQNDSKRITTLFNSAEDIFIAGNYILVLSNNELFTIDRKLNIKSKYVISTKEVLQKINGFENNEIIVTGITNEIFHFKLSYNGNLIKISNPYKFENAPQFIFMLDNIMFHTTFDGYLHSSMNHYYNIGFCNSIKKINEKYFICTVNGFFSINNKFELESLLSESNLEKQNFYGVDFYGKKLWLNASTGIYCWYDNNWVKLLLSTEKSNRITILNKSEALISNNTKIIKIDINCKESFDRKPTFFIECTIVDGQKFSKNKNHKFPYAIKNLELEMNLNQSPYEGESTLFYKYSPDSVWHKGRQLLVLNDLKPGKHVVYLKVKGENNLESNIYKYSYFIDYPFYLKWWFVGFVVIFIFSIGMLFNNFKARIRINKKQIELDRLKALQEQRNQLSQDLHDEIGSGLAKIKYMTLYNSDTKNHQVIEQVSEISNSLISDMRDMLWSLDESNDTVINLISKMKMAAHRLLEGTKIEYFFETNINEELILTGIIRRNIVLILKEAITNTLKHSKANKIKISMNSSIENLSFEIWDNGIGFNTVSLELDQKGKYGLNSMSKRADVIGGKLVFNSNEYGTTITLLLPKVLLLKS